MTCGFSQQQEAKVHLVPLFDSICSSSDLRHRQSDPGILATRPTDDPTEMVIHAISGGSQKTLAEKKKKKQEKQQTLRGME